MHTKTGTTHTHTQNHRSYTTTRPTKHVTKSFSQIQGRSKQTIVAVIGLGYVGLPLALRAQHRGYRVIGIDTDSKLISLLVKREAPSFLDEQDRSKIHSHTMELSSDAHIISDADAIIVCVPTPVSEGYLPDLRPLTTACQSIAPHIARGALVVIESTVNPGVCEEIVLPILEQGSNLSVEEDFYFAHCPERINPGDKTWRVDTIPRVLGTAGEKSREKALSLYEKLIDAPLHPMANIKEAEAVKMVENAFRDINIAFVNELAMSFQKLGIDVVNVIDGASTKPFGFMPHYPGCGVGGHCIPVDPYYLITYARKNGFHHRFLEVARDVNNSMPLHAVSLLELELTKRARTLPGTKVALLGLSYKRDIPDLRESPALAIERELTRRGALVSTFDPLVDEASTARTLADALEGKEAVIIATDHQMFRALAPDNFLQHDIDIVIDGRNCLDKKTFLDAGITYRGIGR